MEVFLRVGVYVRVGVFVKVRVGVGVSVNVSVLVSVKDGVGVITCVFSTGWKGVRVVGLGAIVEGAGMVGLMTGKLKDR